MSDHTWSVRPATAEDAADLADIVIEAIKAQGLWSSMSPAEEDDWRKEYTEWSTEQVDPGRSR